MKTPTWSALSKPRCEPTQTRMPVWCAVLRGTAFLLSLLTTQMATAQGPEMAELPQLLVAAIEHHPSLRARRLDIGAANAEVQAARWQHWPTPTFSVSRPDKTLITGTDRRVEQFGLRQPLWTGGRLQALSDLAQAKQELAQAAWLEVRRDIALEVIQVWGEAYTAQSRMQAWEKSLQVHQRLLDQISRRAELGLSAKSDLELAVGRRQAVLADQMSAQASLDAARERLQTLTGQMPAGRFIQPSDVLPTSMAPEQATEQALALDPTLERMQSEEKELRAQMANTASALWPEVSLNVVQRHGDVTGTRNQVTVSIESKLGGGLSNLSAVEAARQRASAKQEDIVFRKRKLSEQIRADLRQLESIRVRIQAHQKAQIAAQAVAQSWDRQYVAGKKTWQEVMNAAREIAQTEVQLIDASTAATITQWRLALLMGSLQSLLQTQQPVR